MPCCTIDRVIQIDQSLAAQQALAGNPAEAHIEIAQYLDVFGGMRGKAGVAALGLQNAAAAAGTQQQAADAQTGARADDDEGLFFFLAGLRQRQRADRDQIDPHAYCAARCRAALTTPGVSTLGRTSPSPPWRENTTYSGTPGEW